MRQTGPPPSPSEIEASLRKTDLQGQTLGLPLRWFLFFQTYLTHFLLKLRINSRQVTVLWLVVQLAAFLVMLTGTPKGFIAGSLLVYLFIALDWSDGEIGRFGKQFMSPEEDVRTFIAGLYLDRLSHTLTNLLWGVAIAVGLFCNSGDVLVLAAGVPVVVYRGVRQAAGLVKPFIVERFSPRVGQVVGDGGFQDWESRNPLRTGLAWKALEYLDWRIGNSATFNLLILLCSVVDLTRSAFTGNNTCAALRLLFIVVAAVAPFLTVHVLVGQLRRDTILREVLGTCRRS